LNDGLQQEDLKLNEKKQNKMKTSKFWDYLGGMIIVHQPLYNWRFEFEDSLDFEIFKKKLLIPIDEYAENITCPEPCSLKCPREVVEMYDGITYQAVCPEWGNKYFAIEKIDSLYYKLQEHALNKAIAEELNVPFNLMPLRGADDSWRIGEYPLENGESIPVFFTLEYVPVRVLELIIDCNRLTRGGFLLLGMNKHILNQKCEEMLLERGATFIPMNETLDLNREAEFYFLKPIIINETRPEESSEEEPQNIFRKCGDVWEARFQGRVKFMLNSAETGARHLHFMLGRANIATPIIEITRSYSWEPSDYKLEEELLNFDGIMDGYALSDLPVTETCDIADEKAIQSYRQEAQQLSREMDEAKARNDNITLRQLRQDMEKIKQALDGAISPLGQRKKLADPVRNVVVAFRNASNFAIGKIAIYDKQLAEHLRSSIRYGQEPGYFPENHINWEL